MKLYTLTSQIDVNAPIETVFDFFNRPENLEKITPPHLGFKMLTPGSPPMFNGQVLDYEVSLHGIPMRWTSLITNYDPPYSFVDTQLKGPYSFWYHEHRFESLSSGGTRCIDRVSYGCPFGILGQVAHPLIRASLNRIFSYRTTVIKGMVF